MKHETESPIKTEIKTKTKTKAKQEKYWVIESMLFRCAIKYHPTWKYENININGSCTTGSFGTFIVERMYARQQHWMETWIVVIGCYKLYCLNSFLSSASFLFFFFNVSFFVCFGSLLCLHTYTTERDIFKITAIVTTTTTTTMYI